MSIFGFVMYFFSFSALLLDVLCYSLVIVQFGHNLNECVCVCLLSVWERKVSLFFFSLPFLLKFTCTFLQKLKLHEDASKYIFFILWAIANFPTTFLSWFIQNLVLLMLINKFDLVVLHLTVKNVWIVSEVDGILLCKWFILEFWVKFCRCMMFLVCKFVDSIHTFFFFCMIESLRIFASSIDTWITFVVCLVFKY